MKLSRDVQIVLGGAVLYVILSFFDWQQVSYAGYSAGLNEWHGIGFLAALLGIAVLVWEIGRAVDFKVSLGSITPGMMSAGLALLLLVFTVIAFLDKSTARHWPAWIGLVLSIAIAVAAFRRAKAEGVQMPQMPKNVGSMGGGTGGQGSSGSGPSSSSGSSVGDSSSSTDSSTDA